MNNFSDSPTLSLSQKDNNPISWRQGGIVSLLDMLHHYASDFALASKVISDLTSALENYKENKNPLLIAAGVKDTPFDDVMRVHWTALNVLCTRVPLTSVNAQMQRINMKLKCSHTHLELVTLFAGLKDRLEDELQEQKFFYVAANNLDFYECLDSFGEDVVKKFASARDDIESSGRCLALGQPTASVFHMMRAMEVAVRLLGEELGVTVSNKNGELLPWGILIANIEDNIKTMSGEKKKRWSEAQTFLFHVNRAYRTETMHPKKMYTEEQAKEVFNACRTFMKYLADLVS